MKKEWENVLKPARLDKILSDLSGEGRAQVKKDIKKGLVSVNGVVTKNADEKVAEKDLISYTGKEYIVTEFVYYMLNKPSGCVSATEDTLHDTVLSFIPDERKGLFPVGRLDIDTEGLLIITNDGALAHTLLSPKNHVTKVYEAVLSDEVKEPASVIAAFKEGIDIGDEKPTAPAKLTILSKKNPSLVQVSVTEGRFHEVKRMFLAFGLEVLYLKRLSMGGVSLDPTLKPGESRLLTSEEIMCLREK